MTATAAPEGSTLPAATEPECMRADQLAKFLGVNRKTVYAYAMANAIPHRRLGRRIVFSRSQIVDWLGGRETQQANRSGVRIASQTPR